MRTPLPGPRTAGPAARPAGAGQQMRLCRPARPPPGPAAASQAGPSCSHTPTLFTRGRASCRGGPPLPLARAAAEFAQPSETAAAAAAFARAFFAVPAQRDTAAAVLAALLALALVKACDLAASRDWLDRVSVRVGEGDREGGGPHLPAFPRGCSLSLALSHAAAPAPSPPSFQKLTRKLVHTLAGPGFVLCWPLFR